jgi:hypothetical protein
VLFSYDQTVPGRGTHRPDPAGGNRPPVRRTRLWPARETLRPSLSERAAGPSRSPAISRPPGESANAAVTSATSSIFTETTDIYGVAEATCLGHCEGGGADAGDLRSAVHRAFSGTGASRTRSARRAPRRRPASGHRGRRSRPVLALCSRRPGSAWRPQRSADRPAVAADYGREAVTDCYLDVNVNRRYVRVARRSAWPPVPHRTGRSVRPVACWERLAMAGSRVGRHARWCPRPQAVHGQWARRRRDPSLSLTSAETIMDPMTGGPAASPHGVTCTTTVCMALLP